MPPIKALFSNHDGSVIFDHFDNFSSISYINDSALVRFTGSYSQDLINNNFTITLNFKGNDDYRFMYTPQVTYTYSLNPTNGQIPYFYS